MSRKASSPDNAPCEGFFGRLKTELFYARSWLSTTIEDFIAALHFLHPLGQRGPDQGLAGSPQPIKYRRNLGLAT